jgi:hypothetical protein
MVQGDPCPFCRGGVILHWIIVVGDVVPFPSGISRELRSLLYNAGGYRGQGRAALGPTCRVRRSRD